MSWLITGGSGQLGFSVSQELREHGIDYRSWSSRDLDISEGVSVCKAIEKLSPKVIINCAAWTDVDGAESNALLASKINSTGAENIALAAKNCGAKLIHISTDYVFSGEGQNPWQVEAAIDPQSVYGRSKADGEGRVLATYPENSTIVRTAWLYGPWGNNFAKTIIRLAKKGDSKVMVVNDQMGQPTSSKDLAIQLVKLALSDSPSGIYHGTNSGEGTWFDFAQEIFKLVGVDKDRVTPVLSVDYPRPAKRPSYSVLSHDAWARTTVEPMRNWRIALEEAMPAIISAVRREE